jgi:type IV pilus assembly protein PilC
MKLKNKEQRSLWYKKIYYYLKSGAALPEAIRTAATDTDTMYIHEELMEGVRFSEVCALQYFDTVFTKTEISLLKVSEKTGNMQSICHILSRMLKSQHEQYQKLIAAMIYPVLVLCMAAVLLIMILTVVVPKIGPLFSGMKHIPVATRVLIASSDHVVRFWYIDILILFGFCIFILYIRHRTTYFSYIQRCISYMSMYMPYVKDVYMLWFIERWMQIVYLSLQSNVSVSQSLEFAHDSITNRYIQSQFIKITESVQKGNTCGDSMSLVDALLKKRLQDWTSIISSGEKTGTLVDVFGVSHEHIVSNLQDAFDRFQKIIEPALIVCVGVMVLCICLAIILPMYQLTQSIQ